jgi:ubiquinone/menaquinone biosynthesis C-methylase UbiE
VILMANASRGRWEEEADNWLRWARTPNHDDYWAVAPAFFDEIVPQPKGMTLEVGCGEGRSTRDLVARGHRVIAIDGSPTLLHHAQTVDLISRYLVADASSLPFRDGSFGAVVAYNSLMDFDDMAGAVRESARVLQPNGRLCVCVTHPIADAGRFESREAEALFVIRETYLAKRKFEETFERNGIRMTYHGWCYPLEAYFEAFEKAGLLVEKLREPPAPSSLDDPAEERWRRIPNFLHVRALKR